MASNDSSLDPRRNRPRSAGPDTAPQVPHFAAAATGAPQAGQGRTGPPSPAAGAGGGGGAGADAGGGTYVAVGSAAGSGGRGTSMTARQCGHLARWPASSSGACV